ncbi:TPA: hypothetical protein UMV35_000832 [Stenotrophomonas maltophilia]|uniref:hypothetical protein n=1 Tax=Stenotrophomonas maltophilia TaxID=40324 RepID=UPI0013D9BA1C|nr:hypothetical protein [Stenotrophomonas maltophilia]HEL3748574.1 hypothetical protein [Stenotrophomonas maltophilia]HEL7729359.1 hypothetical protein [Stenotrophomonas maltophilia]
MKSTALLTLAWLSALPAVALAQEGEPRNRVVIVENVKFDYAQVLNVEPVFQTLRATRTEEPTEDKGRISRFWDSVRSMFKRSDEEAVDETAAEAPTAPTGPTNNGPMLTRDCRIVPVGREFRRPIAYDVDYVYRGTKYRSRLPEDPGNRLKVRVSITPWVGPEQGTASNP